MFSTQRRNTLSGCARSGARRLSLVVVLLLAGALGSAAQAVADEVTSASIPSVTTELSGVRDPEAFMLELRFVMPRTWIPLTREDAITYELRRRARSFGGEDAMRVAQSLCDEADALGYDPLLFLAVIHIESNYNHLAISPAGAEGLMQLMPPTAQYMADRLNLDWSDGHSFDPVLNVQLGCRYLAMVNKQFRGRMELALTAYNRGPRATRQLLGHDGRLPQEILDFYATKVLDRYRVLRQLYGHLPQGSTRVFPGPAKEALASARWSKPVVAGRRELTSACHVGHIGPNPAPAATGKSSFDQVVKAARSSYPSK